MAGTLRTLFTNNLLPSTATAKGHLAQTRQHLQPTKNLPVDQNAYIEVIKKNITQLKSTSTKDNKKSIEKLLRASMDNDFFPLSDSPNCKTNEVIYSIIDSSPTGLSYIDLTG